MLRRHVCCRCDTLRKVGSLECEGSDQALMGAKNHGWMDLPIHEIHDFAVTGSFDQLHVKPLAR